jgi:hypothetical protein
LSDAEYEPSYLRQPDYLHRRLMAAIRAIADGKGLEDHVPIVGPEIDRPTHVVGALNDAISYLPDRFGPEDIPVVDRAFARLRLERSSDQKGEVAAALLRKLRTIRAAC